jgi:polyhydroxyalkanoate synthesis regulator phasin
MKGKWILASVMVVGSMFIFNYSVARADQTEKLIKILIDKGIISSEEAEELEMEVKKEAPPKEAKSEDEPGQDWIKKIEVGYDKGAYIKTSDDRNSLKLNVRTQGRFRYRSLEERDDDASFDVRRARLLAGGNVFYPWMKYGTQITLETRNAGLRDAWIEAAYYDYARPRIGQYKVPFDREFLTSAFNLQLIDRSLANSEFSLQRDIGVQLSGKFLQDRVNYAVGMFNGSGANQGNQDQNFIYVGRLVYTPFGAYPYSQAALDTPDSPKLALGVAGAYLPGLQPGERDTLAGVLGDTDIVPVNSDVHQLTTDLAFKYRNFSFEGGLYFRSIDPEKDTPFGDQDAYGYYLQGGYFLIPKKFELAARYSWMDPDSPTSKNDNQEEEYTGGFSYYLNGHNLKLQANYSLFRTETTGSDRDDHVVQGLATLAF